MARAVPAIMIAGAHSGAGKTSVTTGLVGALVARGRKVQPFKVGPDYIDPGYLSRAAGRICRNLDSWMVPPEVVRELYARASADADVAVVEGVMGLFDGHPSLNGAGSSAEVAKVLGLPVVLVVDVSHMGQSAAAVLHGFAHLDPELRVVGMIANNVASPAHARLVAEAVERLAGLPVLGCLPRREDIVLPERHLGLIPTDEGRVTDGFFARLSEHVAGAVDLNAVQRLAETALPLQENVGGLWPLEQVATRALIAVARDEAFCFYYQDNLDLLTAHGAQLLPFSPLHDAGLPVGAGGVYLGGGFPEVFAEQLAANSSVMDSIRGAHAQGLPIYAECGGLMYLCQSLADPEGRRHETVGLLPARAVLRGKRVTIGYAEARARRDNPLLAAGHLARGHEFHWSSLEEPFPSEYGAYELADGRVEGYQRDNLLASYVHLHFASNPLLAPKFVAACGGVGRAPC